MGLFKNVIVVVGVAILLNKIPSYFEPELPLNIGGKCLPEFKQVEDIFRSAVENGRLNGGSYAAYHKGKVVCDLWGGYADHESEIPWEENTISIAYSSTKGVGALIAALMVDRGLLEYDKLISDYWPGFGQNGKDNITVKMLLSHQAGLTILDSPVNVRMLIEDGEELDTHLKKSKPFYPPGTRVSYHAITYGLFLDRILRKTDPKQRVVGKIFSEELAKPYDIDFIIGVPTSEHYRIAREYPVRFTDSLKRMMSHPKTIPITFNIMDPNSELRRSAAAVQDFKNANRPLSRLSANTAASGYGNGRSLAKLYGIVANGGYYKDTKVFSDKILKKISTILVTDEVKNLHTRMSVGHGVFFFNMTESVQVLGTMGYGGQFGFADPKHKVSMGFVTNYLTPYELHPVMADLMNAFYECLGLSHQFDVYPCFVGMKRNCGPPQGKFPHLPVPIDLGAMWTETI